MANITCPRCEGRGDISVKTGGVTKCYACGGTGEIDEIDLAMVKKWKDPEKKPVVKVKDTEEKKPRVRKPAVSRSKKPPKPEDTSGKSILHHDAADNYLSGVLSQLESGVDVNSRDTDGRTPLHWPAHRGHLEVVKVLIAHGADVNAADNNGRTPLRMALIGNHQPVIDLLKDKGAL